MKLWLKRSGNALLPDGDEAIAEFSRVPFGKSIHAELRQPRNAKFHRLFFALVHRIAAAKGVETETVTDMLKIATGHCTTIKSKSLGVLRLPKSISFAAMNELEFREFFNRCVETILTEWGIDPASVNDLLEGDLVS